MKKTNVSKKIWPFVQSIVVWLVFTLSVFVMIFTMVSVNLFNRSDRSIFGYKFFVVKGDSMAATDFAVGDLIVCKEIDALSLEEGDIITFYSQDAANFGEVVTHKIRDKVQDEEGNVWFLTYGTTTNQDDESVVPYEYVIGQYQRNIPHVGRFFLFLKTGVGFLLCVILPFLLVLVLHGLKLVSTFLGWRQEQLREITAKQEQFSHVSMQMMALRERYDTPENQALLSQMEEILKAITEKLPQEQGEGDREE